MGLMRHLYLVSAYIRAHSYRYSNYNLLIATLLLIFWSSVTVAADEVSDLDMVKLFNLENTSDPQTLYVVLLPNFNGWHIFLVILSVVLILSCCAFCTYYPFALMQQ